MATVSNGFLVRETSTSTSEANFGQGVIERPVSTQCIVPDPLRAQGHRHKCDYIILILFDFALWLCFLDPYVC